MALTSDPIIRMGLFRLFPDVNGQGRCVGVQVSNDADRAVKVSITKLSTGAVFGPVEFPPQHTQYYNLPASKRFKIFTMLPNDQTDDPEVDFSISCTWVG